MEMKLLDNQPNLKTFIIQKQLEFYFSNVNLKDDWYLSELIQEDKSGYVSLEILKNFDRIRRITKKDMDVVLLAVSQSKLLQISDDGTKVKRIKSYDESPTSENILRKMLRIIKRKIELQFTDYHLIENIPLFMQIEENRQGYVELEFFKSLYVMDIKIEDIKLIAAALSDSSTLKVSDDGTSVRRVIDPFSPEEWDFHTVVVKNLSKETSGRKVKNMFQQCGEIDNLRFFSKKGIKDCFVRFCHPVSVFKACEKFQFGKTENVSEKGGDTENLQTTSASNSLEDKEVSDDLVHTVTKSFENLLKAEVEEDLEEQTLKNGKRKSPTVIEMPDAKRIHLDIDSTSHQGHEMNELSTSVKKRVKKESILDLQIKVIPMDSWKRSQLEKLRTYLRSMEQLKGFGEGNEKEIRVQAPRIKTEPNYSQ